MEELVSRLLVETVSATAVIVVVILGARWVSRFLHEEREARAASQTSHEAATASLAVSCHDTHTRTTDALVSALDRSSAVVDSAQECLGESRAVIKAANAVTAAAIQQLDATTRRMENADHRSP